MKSVCAIVLLVFSLGGSFTLGQEKPAKPLEELVLDLGNGVSMKLVKIPAGKFMMGSPENEKDRQKNEGPQHEVTITKAFYMGTYPVTNEQYKQLIGDTKDIRVFGGPKYPAVSMTWDTAVAFCKKLSEKTGKTVRLPTEAEWEYACRAGTTTRFPYGDDPEYAKLGDYAWYDKNREHPDPRGGKLPVNIRPVGEKKPNPWGLYDMLGNVYQHCSDFYCDASPEADKRKTPDEVFYASGPAVDPTGPVPGADAPWWKKMHVVRGSGWHMRGHGQASTCRSASRERGPGTDQSTGFRVVVEVK
jgi:formylglycine-generating enzyme required for sulfatase activity